jgi:hypothetical protein
VLLGILAAGTTGTVVAFELGRVWRRGSAPLPAEAEDIVSAAEEAVAETAAVAVTGYRDVSNRENALFNMLTSFVATFIVARVVTSVLRSRRSFGPFRNFILGRRHIHHYVPGIMLAFASGAAAIVTRTEWLEPYLAVPFGAGMGLTLDESALLLELEDVYWSEEGMLSVQIALTTTALLGALALGLRFLRRGEQALLAQPAMAG